MPSIHPQSTRPANDVGAAIRRFRERAGLSTRELARRTGVAASYVSKVELGELGAKPEFCQRVTRILRLPESERDLLQVLLALEGAEHHAVPADAAALAKAQRAVRRFERSCTSLRNFQLSVIPGLLQSREYAQSVLSRLGSHSTSSAAVRERLARQEILMDPNRTFRFLIADWVLGSHWCSDRVMRRQLERLEERATRPNVQIRVLPRDFRFPETVPPLVSGFEILDEVLVIVDSMTGFTTYRHAQEVAVYVKAFDEVFPRAARIKAFRHLGAAGCLDGSR